KCLSGANAEARDENIKQFGGWYIEAVTQGLHRVGELIADHDFISVESNRKGRIANGIIACVPNHPIITNYVDEMGNSSELFPVWNTIGGTLFTKMIESFKTKNTFILKPMTFYPFDSKGRS